MLGIVNPSLVSVDAIKTGLNKMNFMIVIIVVIPMVRVAVPYL